MLVILAALASRPGGPYLQASETNFGPGLDLIFGTNWNRFFDFGGL
jgi:hypothetical protein